MSESVSLKEFILSYPFPAFLLSAKGDLNIYGPSLLPTFTNVPFRALLVGPGTATEESVASAWIESLSTVSMAKTFSLWLVPPPGDQQAPYPLVIELNLSWAPRELSQVKLQLVQTFCEGSWVITTVPLHPLPPSSSSTAVEDVTHTRRPALPSLRLNDLPHPHIVSCSTNAGSSPADALEPLSANAAESPTHFEPTHSHSEEIARLIEEYPWEQTVLGPKDSWPESMRSISAQLRHQ